MIPNRTNVDDLIASLKSDLPSEKDEERVRKRLAGIGLFVGASGASLGAHAAQLEAEGQAIWSVTPKSTVLGKLLGLSGTTKAVLVTVAVGSSTLGLPQLLESRADRAEESSVMGTPEVVREPQPEPAGASPADIEERVPSPQMLPPNQKAVPARARVKKLDPVAASSASMPTPASELALETRLMESAIAASQRGDRAAATRYLDLHAAQFPSGALTPERERLRSRL